MTRFTAWMAVLYVVLTILLAYPLTIHPADTVMSAGTDTNLYMWTLAWDAHAFLHQPFSIFDANIFYPFRHTLAYSENLIGSALLAAPVYWVTNNPVLTMNVADLMTVPLCGLGAYVLARRLGVGVGGAALSGVIYGFAPPRFLRLDQAHLTAVEWIPFSLAYAHAYLDSGRRRDLRLAIGFFTLQVLTSGHGAVFLTSALLGLIAYRLALGDRPVLRARARDLGVVGLLLLLPSILVILPYRTVQAEIGLRRTLEGWDMSAVSFLASPTHLHQFLASRLFPHARISEEARAYLFPGYLPLLLAAAAFIWPRGSTPRSPQRPARRGLGWMRLAFALEVAVVLSLALSVYVTVVGGARVKIGPLALLSARQPWRAWLVCLAAIASRAAIARRAPFDVGTRLRARVDAWRRWSAAARHDMRIFYLAIVLACVWLSIGPPYGIWQYVYWLPGLNFVRAPSRFMILGVLALGVLSGLGFERVSARLGSTGRAILAIALGCVLVAEFSPAPIGVVEARVAIPAIDRWLDGRPKPFAIAEVPVRDSDSETVRPSIQSLFMLHAMAHWEKTVNGYSGIEPALSHEVYWELTKFPDEASVRRLSQLGVSYVVVHTDFYAPDQGPAIEARLAQFSDRLRLEHVEGAGRVYSLTTRDRLADHERAGQSRLEPAASELSACRP